MANLLIDENVAIVRATQGLVFLTSGSKFWLTTRGLSSQFVGANVQDFKGKIVDVNTLQDKNECRFLTNDNKLPVLIFKLSIYGMDLIKLWRGRRKQPSEASILHPLERKMDDFR